MGDTEAVVGKQVGTVASAVGEVRVTVIFVSPSHPTRVCTVRLCGRLVDRSKLRNLCVGVEVKP